MNNLYIELLEEAKKASENSYSPYSNFPVGACVLYESGKKYLGCNVENASYGLSICAERNAMANAVASGEETKIEYIAIYSPKQKRCLPCGACRQWISEFAKNDEIKIILENDNQEPLVLSLKELFPYSFKLND